MVCVVYCTSLGCNACMLVLCVHCVCICAVVDGPVVRTAETTGDGEQASGDH